MAYSITLNQPIHFFHRHHPVITHLWWESLSGQERPLSVAYKPNSARQERHYHKNTRRCVTEGTQFIQGPLGGDEPDVLESWNSKIGFQTDGITQLGTRQKCKFQPILFRPLEQQMHLIGTWWGISTLKFKCGIRRNQRGYRCWCAVGQGNDRDEPGDRYSYKISVLSFLLLQVYLPCLQTYYFGVFEGSYFS